MFKAKLITDNQYYALRRRSLILLFLFFFPYFIIYSRNQLPLWIEIISFLPFIAVAIWSFRTRKEMALVTGKKTIEMDENEIRIQSKNKTELLPYKIATADKIAFKRTTTIPTGNLHELKEEILGRPQKNYLLFSTDNQAVRFDFEVDTFYMIEQLNKLIKTWIAKGITIEEITE